jgi:hypothetical protein
MRSLSTLALAGLFGGLLLVGDASACHKKKACTCAAPVAYCAPAPVVCAPAPVVYCAPAPVVCAPAPVVCAPKVKHHFSMPKFSFHKKASVCATYGYAAPGYTAPVTYATPQASGQGM